MTTKIICKNCGKRGHHIRNCISPKCSYGVILYKETESKMELLMIRRRHTLGFVQFIRGQYMYNDIDYIMTLFNVMTYEEIDLIKNRDFKYLWDFLWYNKDSQNSRMISNMKTAYKKYNVIKKGFLINELNINIEYFINNKHTKYSEQEWGFPKGKRNNHESDLNAAKREFLEETGIDKKNVIFKKKLFIENYTSYDNVNYRNIYYLAECKKKDIKLSISEDIIEQITEISAVKFVDINNCSSYVRNYSKAKIKIINDVKDYLKLKIVKNL